MIKIRCQFCQTWIGNMELKMARGAEWEMIATCPDCLEGEKQQPTPDVNIDDLLQQFGMVK